MKTVAFNTLGCKVNQYETEAMMEIFEKRRYKIVNTSDKADVYVINTCTVTNLGDRKSRQFIRRSKKKNPEAIIAVVGCYAQISSDEVLDIPEVDVIVGTNNRNKIVDLCEEAKEKNKRINVVKSIMDVKEFEDLSIAEIKGKTRASLKIQEGCNRYCSYCIIPYARGPIRSRDLDKILDEVRRIADNGFKEIVLTGIHVASYGKDLGDIRLIDVIEEVHKIEGIERIRLSSIEPTIITDEFMERLVKLPKVCDHFHLSLQSGSDTVLERMNRKYTTSQYKSIVEKIRKYMDNVAITTDIIVGFPGETDKEFNETYEFVKDIGFSKIHVFKYSKRQGTPAAKFKNQVNGNVKNDRSKKLIDLGDNLTKNFNSKFIGKKVGVLFENRYNKESNYIIGHTTNYITVLAESENDFEGEIIQVEIKDIKEDGLLGEIIIK
ncbi:tRNA (N(6)-L-threonylcarbamoyladenosine(37)-C(2))-methylthiotransferase MtaB [Dethiothermospora halolimnae]|uniref:tRNA (N(6)-L-threonylcarbamoyladenosine(37)-C(2))- methylthiotransferase MtaB n=1 Tax=Dethiothermospora halolimnae TaxID=3114390 RepID=UPI003CCBB63A